MKLTKKARVGLFGVFAALLFCAVFFANPSHASAISFTENELGNTVLYEFVNPSTIKAKLPGQGEVTFVDTNPFDSTHNFDASNYGCSGDSNDIKLYSPSDDIFNKGGVAPSSFKVIVQVQTKKNTNENGGCTGGESNIDVTNRTSGLEKVRQYFAWVDSATIKNTTGSNANGSKDGDTYKKERTDSNIFYRTGESGACRDNVVINGTGASATAIHTSYSGQRGQNCIIERINFVGAGASNTTGNLVKKRGFTLANLQNANNPGQTSGQTDGDGSAPTCESENSSLIGFIFCPLIDAVDGAVNMLMNAVEWFLTVDTKSVFNQQMKSVWGSMRVIATIGIVLVMLVMILSQAVGWGPFDAYTVKKLLPRLVVAVIAIQLSWAVSIMVIDIFNIIGSNIANLMFAPFGGRDALSYFNVLKEGGTGEFGFFVSLIMTMSTSAGVGALAIGAGSGTLLGGVALAIGLLAISAIAGIFIGFIVLMLRQILLIACVVLAPLAFVMWVLPGTRKYWNLWQETFGKLLLMFPIIIALIALGRIFAFIVASAWFQDDEGAIGELGDAVQSLINAVVVTVGFFGPFFLLPKAFQWGGSLLGRFAGIANDKNKGIFDRARKPLREELNHRRSMGTVGMWKRGVEERRHEQKKDFNKRFGKALEGKDGAVNNEAVGFTLRGLDERQRQALLRRYTDTSTSEEMKSAQADLLSVSRMNVEDANRLLANIVRTKLGDTSPELPDKTTFRVTAEHKLAAYDKLINNPASSTEADAALRWLQESHDSEEKDVGLRVLSMSGGTISQKLGHFTGAGVANKTADEIGNQKVEYLQTALLNAQGLEYVYDSDTGKIQKDPATGRPITKALEVLMPDPSRPGDPAAKIVDAAATHKRKLDSGASREAKATLRQVINSEVFEKMDSGRQSLIRQIINTDLDPSITKLDASRMTPGLAQVIRDDFGSIKNLTTDELRLIDANAARIGDDILLQQVRETLIKERDGGTIQ